MNLISSNHSINHGSYCLTLFFISYSHSSEQQNQDLVVDLWIVSSLSIYILLLTSEVSFLCRIAYLVFSVSPLQYIPKYCNSFKKTLKGFLGENNLMNLDKFGYIACQISTDGPQEDLKTGVDSFNSSYKGI